MNQYTIYCTEAQTKKALELGAPIDFRNGDRPYISVDYLNEEGQLLCHNYDLPTAEQMLGWLESQGINISINYGYNVNCAWDFDLDGEEYIDFTSGEYDSRKETTLAAIDAALNYLSILRFSLIRVLYYLSILRFS